MKRNNNFILREIAGETILVPTGEFSQKINGLITFNSMATFVWKHIDECETPQDMIQLVLDTFDVDEKQATEDINGLLEILAQASMIEI